MQTLTIEARTPESARALHDALSKFDVELRVTDDGNLYVDVSLGQSDVEIVEILGAIQDHVIERSPGPARGALHAVPRPPAAD